ncbi:MAG: branched-chain amino acid ABC transporter permease [Armatimonadetes bacterium]|nr:branched-chain amino acid ABC transporter permease [Armatimonadota bacterium]
MFWVHLLILQPPGFVVGLLFVVRCATPEGKAVGTRLLKFSLVGPGVAILIGAALRFVSTQPYLSFILVRVGIWVILATSLNLINGITGQFSLGHMGFAAVGGYTAASITVLLGPRLGVDPANPGPADPLVFFAALVCGGVAASVAGVLVGLPTLRLRGDYLAIATLGFGEIVRVALLNIPALGGAAGFKGIPSFTTLSWATLWAVAAVLVVRNIRFSRHGRALLAVREDEVAAEAMGVDTVRYKVRAFTIGAFFAGVAGGLLGHYITILVPKEFGFLNSIEVVVMVVLGGMGSITGSVLAAAGLTYLSEALRAVGDVRMILYSLLLILLMLTRPQGLLGQIELGRDSVRRLRALLGKWRRGRAPAKEETPG